MIELGNARTITTFIGALLLAPAGTQAQTCPAGEITFAPSAVDIPTLGGSLLLLLALLLGFLAFRALRFGPGRRSATPLLVAALTTAALLSGVGGVALLRSADAVTADVPSSGGTFCVDPFVLNEYKASPGSSLVVKSLTLPQPTSANCPAAGSGPNPCAVGLQVTDGAVCTANCALQPPDLQLIKGGAKGNDTVATLNEPGGPVVFQVEALNQAPAGAGDATLTAITDNLYGDVTRVAGDITATTCASGVVVAPSARYSCAFTVNLQSSPGTVTNILSATLENAEGTTDSDLDQATVEVVAAPPRQPRVVKGGAPGDDVVATLNEPGGSVVLNVTVTNEDAASAGASTLTSLIDSVYGDVTVVANAITATTCTRGGTLAGGGSYSCSFTVNVSARPGTISGALTATIQNAQGSFTGADAASIVVVQLPPQIRVVKGNAAGNDTVATLNEPGGAAIFNVAVFNDASPGTGEATLAGLTDNLYGNITAVGGSVTATTCATGGKLSGGESYRCSFTANVSADPGTDPVTVTDTLTATLQNSAATLSATDQASVVVTPLAPNLSVVKGGSPGNDLVATLVEPGGPVTFAVAVTNTDAPGTGDATLASLIDSLYGSITAVSGSVTATTCATGGTIVGGTTYNCSFTANVSASPGTSPATVASTVTATVSNAAGTASASDGASVVVNPSAPQPRVVYGNVAGNDVVAAFEEPGGPVVFNVEVFNDAPAGTGLATLTALGNDLFGDITAVAGNITFTSCATGGTIPGGGSYRCSFTAIFAPGPGTYPSLLRANLQNAAGTVTAGDRARVTITPRSPIVRVVKGGSQGNDLVATLIESGGAVDFDVQVANLAPPGTGVADLTSLTDDVFGDITAVQGDVTRTDCAAGATLGGGQSYRCSFTANVGGPPGTYTDTVTATLGNYQGPFPGTDAASVVVIPQRPQTRVVKGNAAGNDTVATLDEPGGAAIFNVTVFNDAPAGTGEAILTALTDNLYGNITAAGGAVTATTCATGGTIAGGAHYSCNFTANVSANPGTTAVTITDTLTARLQNSAGTVPGTDQASVVVTPLAPTLSVVKGLAAGNDLVATLNEPGGPVTFAVAVSNADAPGTGLATLTALTDSLYGNITTVAGAITATTCATGGTIDGGATYNCSFTANVRPNVGTAAVTVADTVSATLGNAAGTATASDGARVVVNPVAPQTRVVKGASDGNDTVATLPASGGSATFPVVVHNDAAAGTGAGTLTALTDNVYGDVTRVQGAITATTCRTGGTIDGGGSYSCSFTATVTGTAGATITDTLTATLRNSAGTISDTDQANVVLQVKSLTACTNNSGGCSATAPCTAAAPWPFITVADDNNFNRVYTKGCMSAAQCKTQWWDTTKPDTLCMSIPAMGDTPTGAAITCTFCCTGDRCNQDNSAILSQQLNCSGGTCPASP